MRRTPVCPQSRGTYATRGERTEQRVDRKERVGLGRSKASSFTDRMIAQVRSSNQSTDKEQDIMRLSKEAEHEISVPRPSSQQQTICKWGLKGIVMASKSEVSGNIPNMLEIVMEKTSKR